MRLLRQYSREYFYNSVQWAELFAAFYLDLARVRPLAGSGALKKLQGLSHEAFIEFVLCDCREIDVGQISWHESVWLLAALRKPFATGSNIKTDPSQIKVQNAKKQN